MRVNVCVCEMICFGAHKSVVVIQSHAFGFVAVVVIVPVKCELWVRSNNKLDDSTWAPLWCQIAHSRTFLFMIIHGIDHVLRLFHCRLLTLFSETVCLPRCKPDNLHAIPNRHSNLTMYFLQRNFSIIWTDDFYLPISVYGNGI